MSTSTPVYLNISDIPSTSHHLHASINTLCHSGGISDLYEVVDAIWSIIINDADDLEANLVMDLARARWDVFNAEKALADCMVREHEVMANLMRITFKKYGFSHHEPAPSLQESLGCHHIMVQLD
ncbi:uncharacterized protein EDB91DRAFT_1253531 [Suillus paluster]|uniref:uncharacterized protein n=1 Tax=Suillus paluster TaxID=48578 RepID=UPI001B86364F|nr:uncharacterized protein EDB91DRAFT_1253531 [Suillus paluster]KAG1728267.1 hypothetical protein EDB91DRAFT_1253531 [Suillus paluster]